MGIRFVCHGCGRRLNVKGALAGKRGVCPGCSLRFRIPHSDAATSIRIAPGEPLEKVEETIAQVDSVPADDLSRALPEMKQFVTTIRDVKVQIGEHLIGALQQHGTVGVLTTVVLGRDGQQRVISASLGPDHAILVDELIRIAKVREAEEYEQKQGRKATPSDETVHSHDTRSKYLRARSSKQQCPRQRRAETVTSETATTESTNDDSGRKNFAPWRT